MLCQGLLRNSSLRNSAEIFASLPKAYTASTVTGSNNLQCEHRTGAKCIWKSNVSNRYFHLNGQYSWKNGLKCNQKPHLLTYDSIKWLNRNTNLYRISNTSTVHSLVRKPDVLCMQSRRALNEQYRSFSLSPKYILDASPSFVKPYLRLIRFDKPIGTWLLYWPCTWSIALAASPGCLPDLWLLTLFGMGSFFMRGAGCIINDMWDKDYDKKVERTKQRPLASGELTQFQGLLCLAGMLSVSLGILLQLNTYSILLGASSMLLVILYPLAKRYTYWPQAMLGITLNWGVLLAWSAIHGSLQWSVIPLYIGCVFYTMTYDSIYAHQDKYDDMLIGVKSTALKFGDKTKPWLTGFATTMIGGLTLTGYMCEQTWPYFVGVAITAAHLSHQIYDVDLNNADDCAKKFRSNSGIGLVLFLATIAGTLLKKDKKEEKVLSQIN